VACEAIAIAQTNVFLASYDSFSSFGQIKKPPLRRPLDMASIDRYVCGREGLAPIRSMRASLYPREAPGPPSFPGASLVFAYRFIGSVELALPEVVLPYTKVFTFVEKYTDIQGWRH
jgi:hypothetical protein